MFFLLKKDCIYLALIIMLMIFIPLGIQHYDESLKPNNLIPGTKEFILTGNSEKGWIVGEFKAYAIFSFFKKKETYKAPVLRVSRGDQVLLKLRSSDVTHGFSMKAYGIYITNGIEPGQTVYVQFKADKTGTFNFACNVYCGDIHHMMHGTLVVEE